MSSSPVPLKTRRLGQRCTPNLSRAETSSHWIEQAVEWLPPHIAAPRSSPKYKQHTDEKLSPAVLSLNLDTPVPRDGPIGKSPTVNALEPHHAGTKVPACIAVNGMSSRNSTKTSSRNTKYDCPESRIGHRYGPRRQSRNMPAHTLRDKHA
ncbi:hypothetical protein TNCV_2799821 [Trichonephila clavipes]|nr:hypothetical protein TNCV_2799821 [Trichonephila clavipes]